MRNSLWKTGRPSKSREHQGIQWGTIGDLDTQLRAAGGARGRVCSALVSFGVSP